MDENSNLEKLRILTGKLSTLSETVLWKNRDRMALATIGGSCDLLGVYNEPGKCSIVTGDFAANTTHSRHSHPQTEIIICVLGVFEVHLDDGEIVVLHPTESITLKPSTPHSCHCDNDAFVLAIVIPDSTEFPNGKS